MVDLIVRVTGVDLGEQLGAEQPIETWQSDFTHYRLVTVLDVETITWLDDHSRMALHISAHLRITDTIVVERLRRGVLHADDD